MARSTAGKVVQGGAAALVQDADGLWHNTNKPAARKRVRGDRGDRRNIGVIPPAARETILARYVRGSNPRRFTGPDGWELNTADFAKWVGDLYGFGTAKSRAEAVNAVLVDAGLRVRS
jgi:hypothetical protein